MTTIVERLRARADKLFGIRDRVGFKQRVYLLTRTWPATIGSGTPTDVVVRMVPNPGIRDLSHQIRISSSGEVFEGNITLTGIPQNLYTEAALGNNPNNPLVERFYLIDKKTYSVQAITQNFVSWDVTLIKTNKDLWQDSLIP